MPGYAKSNNVCGACTAGELFTLTSTGVAIITILCTVFVAFLAAQTRWGQAMRHRFFPKHVQPANSQFKAPSVNVLGSVSGKLKIVVSFIQVRGHGCVGVPSVGVV